MGAAHDICDFAFRRVRKAVFPIPMDRDLEDHKPCLESPLIQASQEGVSESRKGEKRREILGEVKKQLKLAGPLASVNLLICSLQMISLMFVGHLGELPLSGASMATSFASVTGFSLMVSISYIHGFFPSFLSFFLFHFYYFASVIGFKSMIYGKPIPPLYHLSLSCHFFPFYFYLLSVASV